jgi:hypothetical protein
VKRSCRSHIMRIILTSICAFFKMKTEEERRDTFLMSVKCTSVNVCNFTNLQSGKVLWLCLR